MLSPSSEILHDQMLGELQHLPLHSCFSGVGRPVEGRETAEGKINPYEDTSYIKIYSRPWPKLSLC